jgi:hypothetical protein
LPRIVVARRRSPADKLIVFVAQPEAGPGQGGSVAEQPNRLGPADLLRTGSRRPGHRQRRDRPARLPVDAKPALAGSQDPDPRAGAQQPGQRLRHPAKDTLAVVHDQQGLAVSYPCDDVIEQRRARLLVHRQSRGERGRDQLRAGEGSQLY